MLVLGSVLHGPYHATHEHVWKCLLTCENAGNLSHFLPTQTLPTKKWWNTQNDKFFPQIFISQLPKFCQKVLQFRFAIHFYPKCSSTTGTTCSFGPNQTLQWSWWTCADFGRSKVLGDFSPPCPWKSPNVGLVTISNNLLLRVTSWLHHPKKVTKNAELPGFQLFND